LDFGTVLTGILLFYHTVRTVPKSNRKTTKYHTVRTVPKSNRKTTKYHTVRTVPKSNRKTTKYQSSGILLLFMDIGTVLTVWYFVIFLVELS
jgi:hypothetical protein